MTEHDVLVGYRLRLFTLADELAAMTREHAAAQGAGVVAVSSRIEAELRQVKQALAELSEGIARLRTQLREVEVQADSQMQSRQAIADEYKRVAGFDPRKDLAAIGLIASMPVVTARLACVLRLTRASPSHANRHTGQRQFHWGKPPPAAAPRTMAVRRPIEGAGWSEDQGDQISAGR